MTTRLSKDFSLASFCKSQTAERLGLDNTPSQLVIANASYLTNHLLQPLRDYVNKPIIFNSGYRSKVVNKATGGVPTSQHVLGQAADIECTGISNYELACIIYKRFEFDQLILEYYNESVPDSGWVHVSLRSDGKNRKESLQINKHGKTTWKPK
jgi:hypothetical protein